MKISVVKWEKYQPRRDVAKSSWFRMEHAIVLSTKYLSLTQRDIMALVYIFSVCSEENSDTIEIQPTHLMVFGRGLTLDELTSSALNLQRLDIVHVSDTGTLREKHADVSLRTNERTNETYERTDGKHVRDTLTLIPLEQKNSEKKELPELAMLWNKHACSELPRIKRCGPSRQKIMARAWKSEPREEFWLGVFEKINTSGFLTGKVHGDKGPFFATLTWVLEGDHLDKILEGFYNRTSAAPSKPKSLYAQMQESDAHAK